MKKILSLIILLLIGGSLFSQNLRLKRLRADTVIISNYQFSRSDTLLKWSNDTVKMGFTKGSAADPFVVVYVDTLLGSFPSIDSCLDYIKVKRIASCSPLWLSSPDSVWVTGELRQIDGSVAFRGTSGANPFHNDGTLFMWYGAKAALRAGYGNQNQWTTSNIGDYSVALGYNVIASGKYSFAANGGNIGTNNIASGDFSFVCGQNNLSSANSSFSGGTNCSATNGGTFVFGVASSAMAQNSYAIGNTLIANKFNQIVFGFQNDTTKNTLLSVGNGYAAVRSNSLEVYADSVVRTPGKFVQYFPEHSFTEYSDNTGYAVQISSAGTWYDVSDSTANRYNPDEMIGFQYDNDTLVYVGYDDAHLRFTVSISSSGTNAHDFIFRVYNVTDGAEVAVQKHVTTTGAGNRQSVTLLGYDHNASIGDRYVIQVSNQTAGANVQIFDIGIFCDVTHYVH